LLRTPGTTVVTEGDSLAYSKDNPAAQDKLAPIEVLHSIDEFPGAPAPDDPNQKKKDENDDEGRHSPDEGYFLAGVFALIHGVGRWLEPRLVRRRFKAALAHPPTTT